MEFVTYEVEGAVGIITINRPKALNALNSAVLEELNQTLDAVDKNEIRCLILTGAGEKSFVAGALGGVDPKIMGVGPVASTKKVLAKTGMSIDDFDLIEANEAFAAQSVAVGRDLGFDLSKLNVNGGAIALGHPVGASGCRILVTLLHEMQKRDVKRGLATLCIGGGMGCSTIVERD